MSYIKIQKIKKENVEIPEKGYVYLGYDDSDVDGSGKGLWLKDDDGTISYYVLSGYASNPTITVISPPLSSYIGDTITINGTNFIPSITTVTFNGVAGTSVNVLSVTQLTVVVPNVQGLISVIVSSAYGPSDPYSYTINYKDIKPIIIPPISPSTASVGSTITIGGFNFVPGNTITWFNGVSGITSATNSALLTAIIPQMPSGQTIIFLETPYGQSSPPVSYYITDTNPTFTSFYPSYGYVGDTISISGTNFAVGQIQVRFGSTQASGITVHDTTHITAIISSETPFGDTLIRVDNALLTGFTVSGDTTGLLPVIDSILPLGASIEDTITLSGTNFLDTVSVTFSGELVEIISNSLTFCTIRLSANVVPGINSVYIKNKYGISNVFYYTISHLVLGPVITTFDPISASKNAPVNLNGSNFQVGSGNYVYFGGISVKTSNDASSSLVKTQLKPVSSTQYIPNGYVDVKITNAFGAYTKSGFLVNVSGTTPIVTSISPIFANSGTIIDIYGQYLTGGTVSFGDSYPGISGVTTVIDDTHLTAIVPIGLVSAGENRYINIYVTTTIGTFTYTPFDIYELSVISPTILSYTPVIGSKGTLVSISGDSFTKYYTDASIYIGGVYYILDSQTYISKNEIRGYIPETYGQFGAATIKIENPVGSSPKSTFTITV